MSDRYWRFLTPERKRETGILRNGRRPYLTPPSYGTLPLYVPLRGCSRFEVVGALQITRETYQCRVRVWPSGGDRECAGEALPSPPITYLWRVVKQPLTRPVCYEDDPLQQGISTGPPFGGCWLGDAIRRDDGWRGDDEEDDALGPTGGGGEERRLQPAKRVERQLAVTMR